jgi:hypothetical protein
MRDLPRFLWVVINNWAGYATGGLIVATCSLYFLSKDKPMPRIVGFVLSGIFLLLAFYKAWHVQHEEVLRLQAELDATTKPHFEVVISQALANYHSSGFTIALVQMGIMNIGAASSVRYMKAHYESATLNQDVDIVYLPSQEEIKAFPDQSLTMDRDVGNLMDNTRAAITTRSIVPGKIFLRIPGNHIQVFAEKKLKVTITAHDYLGNPYSGWFPNDNERPFNLPFHELVRR